jgi:hypothetical protein
VDLDAGFDSIPPASNDQRAESRKALKELMPGAFLKAADKKQNETIQRLHDASTDSFERRRLNVELYNNERD